MPSEDENLTLFTYFRSSCSARIRIALNLKGLEYESIPVNLLKAEHSSANFKRLNPSGLVPALRLRLDNRVLTQSIAIIEYIEEVYPEHSLLLPSKNDLIGRAHVRGLANIIACDTQPVTNMRVLNRVAALKNGEAKDRWARELMKDGLRAYETMAAKVAGRFSYGDNVTLADVCLVPAVWGAQRFGVDINQFPVVSRVYHEMSHLEAVKKAHWKHQPDTPEELRN
jgi:maleylacetoacetate isomerase